MNEPLALIVDDEPDILELLDITLGRMGIRTRSAVDLAGARQLLDQQRFDLCLTDMRLPDGDGIELVRYINHGFPQTPVAVITAHGSMNTAIEALKAGAFDFLSKPVGLEALRGLVANALNLQPRETPEIDPAEQTMLGNSPVIQQTRTLIRKLARSQAPVYITGESGTGKELAARLIHNLGARAKGPFVAVNCGAIPQDLMESELFGHRKGSFTGANADYGGLFQAAHGGTLFLDEVADLPLSMQVKLLRAIQERSIRPVGAPNEIAIDVRILSASHRELTEMVDRGKFRQDLFYRLNVIQLEMPPLRKRREDIVPIAKHILSKLCARSGLPDKTLHQGACRALEKYPFPGNVRELENILERGLALCESNSLDLEDLGLHRLPAPTAVKPNSPLPLDEMLENIERDAILQALQATGWNRTEAAKRLGISFRSLRYKLAKLHLSPADDPETSRRPGEDTY